MANPSVSKQVLLRRLGSQKWVERLAAVEAIGNLPSISSDIAHALELVALLDENISVRKAAQRALGSPAYRADLAKRTSLKPGSRQTVASEIQAWKKEGLIDSELSQVLLSRYTNDAGPISGVLPEAKKINPPTPAKKERPNRSLSEILFSETTIKIALFLGAFFILAAALILAALNASLRIPILVAVAVIFLIGAVALRRRLPTASLTLFVVYALLIPITARVILNTLSFLNTYSYLYWLAINVFLLVNWVGAIRQYGSKIFSLLAFVSLNLLPFQISQILVGNSQLTILLAVATNLFSIMILVALANTKLIKQQLNFIFILSQIWQGLLLISIPLNVIGYGLLSYRGSASFFALGPACLFSVLYYLLAQHIKPSPFFAYLATLNLAVFPWFFLSGLSVHFDMTVLVTWIWGSLFALSADWFSASKQEIYKMHGKPVILASGLLYIVAGIGSLMLGAGWALGIFAGIAAIYTYLTYKKPRPLVWGAALLAYFCAYLAFFQIPFMQRIDVFMGFVFLVPTLAYLSLDLFFFKSSPKQLVLHRWPRVYGLSLAAFTGLVLAVQEQADLLRSSIAFLILAAFFLFYTQVRRIDWYGYVAGGALALALAYLLMYRDVSNLTYPLLGLATIYYAAGWALVKKRQTVWWGRISYINGLGLAALSALFRPGLTNEGNWIFVLVFSVGLYLAADLNANQSRSEIKRYRTFTRLGSIGLTLIGAGLALTQGPRYPLDAAIAFALYGLLFLLYAKFSRTPKTAYVSTAAFVGAIYFIENYFNTETWLYGLLGLSLLYLLFRRLPQVSAPKDPWRPILRSSSLSIAALVGLAAIGVGGTPAVISAALAASIFALEAYQQRSVRMAAVADLFYLEAYLLGLITLNLREPQYYSIGAALLGIVMHYLLVRGRIPTGRLSPDFFLNCYCSARPTFKCLKREICSTS